MDEITGIAPAIAIKQKNSTRNPRSTVATATEIYDYLRLLYARAGRTFCTNCGNEVRKDTMDEIAARVLTALPQGRRFYVLYTLGNRRASAGNRPPGRGKKTGQGFSRGNPAGARRIAAARLPACFQAGRVHEFSSPETLLDIDFSQPVYVVVDRLAIGPDMRSRLVDSVEICYREGRGEAILEFVPEAAGGPAERMVFNERFECKTCGTVYQEPGTAPIFVQQSLRGLPALPGLRKYRRFRYQSGDSRPRQVAQRRRDPAVDQAALPSRLLADLRKNPARAKYPRRCSFRNLTAAQRDMVIEGEPKSGYQG